MLLDGFCLENLFKSDQNSIDIAPMSISSIGASRCPQNASIACRLIGESFVFRRSSQPPPSSAGLKPTTTTPPSPPSSPPRTSHPTPRPAAEGLPHRRYLLQDRNGWVFGIEHSLCHARTDLVRIAPPQKEDGDSDGAAADRVFASADPPYLFSQVPHLIFITPPHHFMIIIII